MSRSFVSFCSASRDCARFCSRLSRRFSSRKASSSADIFPPPRPPPSPPPAPLPLPMSAGSRLLLPYLPQAVSWLEHCRVFSAGVHALCTNVNSTSPGTSRQLLQMLQASTAPWQTRKRFYGTDKPCVRGPSSAACAPGSGFRWRLRFLRLWLCAYMKLKPCTNNLLLLAFEWGFLAHAGFPWAGVHARRYPVHPGRRLTPLSATSRRRSCRIAVCLIQTILLSSINGGNAALAHGPICTSDDRVAQSRR